MRRLIYNAIVTGILFALLVKNSILVLLNPNDTMNFMGYHYPTWIMLIFLCVGLIFTIPILKHESKKYQKVSP